MQANSKWIVFLLSVIRCSIYDDDEMMFRSESNNEKVAWFYFL